MIANPTGTVQVDFATLAPQIIDEVAKTLMPNRPIFQENDREIRFGNKGSFLVDKRDGTFYDFEDDTGGGILDMIVHVERLENRRQAFQWLKNHGFLDGPFTLTQHKRPRPQPRARQSSDTGFFKLGLQLWKESEPIHFLNPIRSVNGVGIEIFFLAIGHSHLPSAIIKKTDISLPRCHR